MKHADEAAKMRERRGLMYRFIARFYRREADLAFLETLAAMRFPGGNGERELFEGYRLFTRFLEENGTGSDTEEALAADYARIFLAAGRSDGEAAFPYESVYADRKRLVKQEAWSDVRRIYREAGVGLSDAPADCLEDHISCELEFMACLCGGQEEAAQEQQAFLENHLLNWIPAFTEDVLKYAETDFYRAAAKMTRGFILLEQSLLCEGGIESGTEA